MLLLPAKCTPRQDQKHKHKVDWGDFLLEFAFGITSSLIIYVGKVEWHIFVLGSIVRSGGDQQNNGTTVELSSQLVLECDVG